MNLKKQNKTISHRFALGESFDLFELVLLQFKRFDRRSATKKKKTATEQGVFFYFVLLCICRLSETSPQKRLIRIPYIKGQMKAIEFIKRKHV